MSVNEIVSVLNESFPNFHLTKAVNAEVGRALRHLGYQSKKTKTCQVYYITKNQ